MAAEKPAKARSTARAASGSAAPRAPRTSTSKTPSAKAPPAKSPSGKTSAAPSELAGAVDKAAARATARATSAEKSSRGRAKAAPATAKQSAIAQPARRKKNGAAPPERSAAPQAGADPMAEPVAASKRSAKSAASPARPRVVKAGSSAGRKAPLASPPPPPAPPARNAEAESAKGKAIPKSVGWALTVLARLHRGELGERLAALGLFPGQEQLLQALHEHETMTMGALSDLLRVRPPTASKAVARLSAQGLVARVDGDSHDGRLVRVRLTREGRARASEIASLWQETEQRLLAGFDGRDRKKLRKMLRRAAENFTAATDAPRDDDDADVDA